MLSTFARSRKEATFWAIVPWMICVGCFGAVGHSAIVLIFLVYASSGRNDVVLPSLVPPTKGQRRLVMLLTDSQAGVLICMCPCFWDF